MKKKMMRLKEELNYEEDEDEYGRRM